MFELSISDRPQAMFDYRCPQCGTSFQIRQRVTQRKRRCPHCGAEVAVDEIDAQVAEANRRQAGCTAGCFAAFILVVAVGGGLLVGKPWIALGGLLLFLLIIASALAPQQKP